MISIVELTFFLSMGLYAIIRVVRTLGRMFGVDKKDGPQFYK